MLFCDKKFVGVVHYDITSKNNYCIVKKEEKNMTARLFEGNFFVAVYRSFHLSCGSSLSGQHQGNLGGKKRKPDPPGRRKATNFSKFHFPPPENCSSQFLFPFDPTQRNSCVDPDLPRTRKERRKGKKQFSRNLSSFPV